MYRKNGRGLARPKRKLEKKISPILGADQSGLTLGAPAIFQASSPLRHRTRRDTEHFGDRMGFVSHGQQLGHLAGSWIQFREPLLKVEFESYQPGRISVVPCGEDRFELLPFWLALALRGAHHALCRLAKRAVTRNTFNRVPGNLRWFSVGRCGQINLPRVTDRVTCLIFAIVSG